MTPRLLWVVAFVAALSVAPASAQTARCTDGTTSDATTRAGACSGHGGVAEWVTSSTPPPANQPAVRHATLTPTKTTPARSAAAKAAFMRQTGYPKGRAGYVVDHIIPLACGGADAPTNMQWQTVAEAKAKDKVERVGCR